MEIVTIGVDSHKRTHTAVAVDAHGRALGERTVAATSAGHLELVRWAAAFPDRRWALEDCRTLSRRLEQDLLAGGEPVARVPPRLMADARRSVREIGKSDPIDALAVARVALREPDLPTARLDGPERELRLLVDHRDDLVTERTRIENRLHWILHELMPGEQPAPRTLARRPVLERLEARLSVLDGLQARLGLEHLRRIGELTAAINRLGSEIDALVRRLAPTLLALPGCGPLSAAKLVGETAGIDRFRSAAAFARHNGSAPVPVWSGNTTRYRLSRGGNRQLNAALHRIAITQLRLTGAGRAYFEHRIGEGDTRTEAIRALKRRISDEVYRRLRSDALRDRASALISMAA